MLYRLIRYRSQAINTQCVSRRFKSRWADGGDHATHNDLPVPKGDWKEYYTKRNGLNNFVLISGLVALAASSYMLFFSGVVTFNASPPAHWRNDDEC